MSADTLNEALCQALSSIHRLAKFSARIITDQDFQTHIDSMPIHFRNYAQMYLTGHFSNAFTKKIRGLPKGHPGCDFRVLSIDPRKNKSNLNALNELKKEGAKVKIHDTLHARMFIGITEETDTWYLIVGSYDYNREGISGENENIGMYTENPEIVKQAREIFMKYWSSPLTREV